MCERPRLLKLSLIVTLLCGLSRVACAEHRQVFLLGGQSNMVGTGTHVAGPPLSNPLPEVRFYFGTPNGSTLLPQDTWIDLAPGSGGIFGPELSFGHALHATDPAGHYALIKYARGGSDVYEDWNPNLSDNMYTGFRSTVDAALQALNNAGDTYEIVGMLWTQGIRDGKEGRSAEQYRQDLADLFADVRLNYGADLPVFISRLSIAMTGASIAADGYTVPSCRIGRDTPECPPDPALPGYGLNGIRAGQEAVAANDPRVFLIDTDTFPSDNTHFHTDGQIALGEAFAASYFQNVVIPEPRSSTILATLFVLRMVGPTKRGGTGRNRRQIGPFGLGVACPNAFASASLCSRFWSKSELWVAELLGRDK